jgi:hypothetical protein
MNKFNKKYNNSECELYELTEIDFYPPVDTRLYNSGIYDIVGGDNFDEYVNSFYEDYENELFDN